jgi:Copper transport outer membrane protein, MctB
MIDFRYHLVSLVSVFLALAVGIVLGAGPLKDSISDTLSQQVNNLRQEKDTLRTSLDTANTGLAHRDSVLTEVTPALVRNQLTGRSVLIVALPGVSNDDLRPLTDAVIAAGATTTGQIAIDTSWTDPVKAADRGALAAKLAESVPATGGGGSAASGDVSTQLARFLASAVLTNATADPARGTPATGTVIQELSKADLIDVRGGLATAAGAALVVAPANENALGGDAKATTAPDTAAAYLTLAAALDNAGSGAVVTGPSSSALTGGLIAAIRTSDTARTRVSTVDSGTAPMGVVAAILALREQVDGRAGQYGFQDGANDPMPALTQPAPAQAAPAQAAAGTGSTG